MTEIALKIANQVIQLPEPRPRLVAGSAGVYAVTLAYDAQWDDATVRVVVFDGGLCNQRVPVQDTSGTVPIPPECIAHGGRGNWLQIGVLGYDGTGTLRITTRAMLDGLRIDPAGASDADVPQEPPAATPGLWEKLVADVGNLSDLQTSDTSSLVAAINELAAKPAGYKPYPIALTQNGNKWTADHTLAEVKEALAQGYSPYCIYNSWPIPCTGVEDNFVFYTGWLGAQTTAVWIMQSKSGANVIARNTFGTDYLSHLVDSDGSFGRLNTLIATNPRTAVVYNLGGTPEGQDLSAMTFPALLWGTATDATARTQTFGLTGAGGDQWRGVQNFDTKAVTFEQVGAGTTVDATLSVEGAAADAAAVGSAVKALAKRDVESVYYFWTSHHTNDVVWAYNQGAPAVIAGSFDNGRPDGLEDASPPCWVVFGNQSYGKVSLNITDARGMVWGGQLDLRDYSIVAVPLTQTLNLTGVKKGQIPRIASVSEGEPVVPTAWEAADLPEADNSLGLSSATIGQTIKVKAVDTDGKPTAWEAVDMAGGEREWVEIGEVTTTEDTTEKMTMKFTQDVHGNPLSLKGVLIIGKPIFSDTNKHQCMLICNDSKYGSNANYLLYERILRNNQTFTVYSEFLRADGLNSVAVTAFNSGNVKQNGGCGTSVNTWSPGNDMSIQFPMRGVVFTISDTGLLAGSNFKFWGVNA